MEFVNLTEVDFANPAEVLCQFFVEMNRWEVGAWKLYKQSKEPENEKVWAEIQANWKPLFDKFCTQKKRVYGQHRSVGKPPGYDPDSEVIVDINYVKPNKVIIKTACNKPFEQEFYYVLFKKNNKWLIDHKYYFGSSQKIVRVIL